MGGNPSSVTISHRRRTGRRIRDGRVALLRDSCWWDHPPKAALSGPRTPLKPFPQPWSWMGRITYPGVT